MRQRVLNLPLEIRYRIADDGHLLSDVLGVFLRVVRRVLSHPAERVRPQGRSMIGLQHFSVSAPQEM